MDSMCVVEAKYAAFVYSGQVRQEERQIVSNNFTFTVHPDLLPENAYPTGTPKPGLVVSVFAAFPPMTFIVEQVMFLLQQLLHSLFHLCGDLTMFNSSASATSASAGQIDRT